MAVVGDSLVRVLVLMALVAALTALILRQLVSRELDSALSGTLIGLVFLLVPVVQSMYATVMLDLPVTAFSLAAAVSFGTYLDHGRRGQLAAFGLFTICAILTKDSGYALGWMAPLSMVLAGRLDLLRKAELWIAAVGVLAASLPWHVATRDINRPPFHHTLGLAWLQASIPIYLREVFVSVPGFAVGVLCMIGLSRAAWTATRTAPLSGTRAAVIGLFLGTIIFMMAVPVPLVPRSRYLLGAVPGLLLLALEGAKFLLETTPIRRLPGSARAWSAGLVALLFLATGFRLQPREAWATTRWPRSWSGMPS